MDLGNHDERILNTPMNRRQFCQLVTMMGAMGYIDNIQAAFALETDTRRVGWRAFRTPGAEGVWELNDVEGTVPQELDGTLYRTAPGLSENHGVVLQHLFDGDAFVSGYTIRDGKITLRANFVKTPQRLEELEAGRMLYGEFGTAAPPLDDGSAAARRYGGKNQPNVNIIPWGGQLLGLSEGGHPAAIDPQTMDFKGYWDFYGTLPQYVTFTAHPRFDAVTGTGYTYGTTRNAMLALKVYRMETNGKLAELHHVPLGGYYMIHDMLLSANHIVFVVPPIKYDFMQLATGKMTPAEAAKYYGAEPLKLIILSRDGSGEPIVIEQPSNSVFHHGNAFERENGELVIDSMLAPDGTILDRLANWANDKPVPYANAQLTRLVLDLNKKEVVSKTVLGDDQEFPRFDFRQSFKDAKYLYGAENSADDDLAFNKLVRTDLHTGEILRFDAGPERALGEPVFVPHPDSTREDRGWILQLGYDTNRDKTYLEFRDAGTLEFVARAWAPTHLPLGFHGNWVDGWHIKA